MTRQIAIAISLAAFLTMAVSGLLTYAIARDTVLRELDQTMVARAIASLPRDKGVQPAVPGGDRFVVENELGQTLARSPATAFNEPRVISSNFTGAAGERSRTLVLEFGDPASPTRVVYSTPAAAFDRLQNHLALGIGGSVVAGGLLTAITAVVISRRVVRPLQRTADVIGSVDDAHLDRRIDREQVPAELAPMVDHLNQMLARLEEAFRRQNRFLADAAHELRTPVAAMRAGLEIALSRVRTPEHLTDVVSKSLRESIRLGKTIEVMLESVRTGSEQRLHPEAFDLSAMLRQCVEQARPLAAQRSDELCAALPDSMPIYCEIAPVRSIVWNLISNAIAHTPPGISVTIRAKRSGAGYCIDLSDTGAGISPDHLSKIFEPFFRADPSRSGTQHLGLGLYLVQQHARRLGGNVTVKSVLDQGTTFSVWLPAGDAASTAIARQHASPVEPSAGATMVPAR